MKPPFDIGTGSRASAVKISSTDGQPQSIEFRAMATVFCRCGWMMDDYSLPGTFSCANPICPERGRDYKFEFQMVSTLPADGGPKQ